MKKIYVLFLFFCAVCSAVAQVPNTQITASATTVCNGTEVTLNIPTTIVYDSVAWYKNGTLIANSNNDTLNALTDVTSTYKVDVFKYHTVNEVLPASMRALAVGDIITTDSLVVKPTDWSSASAAGKTAAAVVYYLSGDTVRAVGLQKSTATIPWGFFDIAIPSLQNYNSGAAAELDMNGQANTDFILTYNNNNTHLKSNECAAVWADSVGGYLPSAGELMKLSANRDFVNASLSTVGGETYSDSYWYWSSTSYSPSYAWLVGTDGSLTSSFRLDYYYVREVRAFKVESIYLFNNLSIACVATDEQEITVNAQPVISTGNIYLCAGECKDTLRLAEALPGNLTAADNNIVSVTPLVPDSVFLITPATTADATTTLTYTATSGGCSAQVTATVYAVPEANITASATAVCPGTEVTLNIPTTSVYDSVAWYKNGTLIANSNNDTLNALTDVTSTYKVDVFKKHYGPASMSALAVGDIITTDSLVVKPTDWSSASAAGKTAAAVVYYLSGDTVRAVGLQKSTATIPWGFFDIAIPSLQNYNSGAAAELDMNGQANTDFILTYNNNNTHLKSNECAAVWADSVGGYLPSAGELMKLSANRDFVNASLSTVGGETYSDSYWYWSSTSYSPSYAWLVGTDGSLTSSFRLDYYYVREVRAFKVESIYLFNNLSIACVATDEQEITVNAQPVISTGNIYLCAGECKDTLRLAEALPGNLTAADNNIVSVTPLVPDSVFLITPATTADATTTLTYTATSGGCSAQVTATVYAVPEANITASDTAVYPWTEVTLNIPTTSVYDSVAWYKNGTLIANSNNDTLIALTDTTSTYKVDVFKYHTVNKVLPASMNNLKVGDIITTDSLVVKPTDWSSASAAGKTAAAVVYYLSGDTVRAVGLQQSTNIPWGFWNVSIPELPNYTSIAAAELDMNGQANTAAILAYNDTLSTPLYSNECAAVWADSVGGYLPSAGELVKLSANRDSVNASLLTVGGETFDYWYWSSTSHTPSIALYVYCLGSLYTSYRRYYTYAIEVRAFKVESIYLFNNLSIACVATDEQEIMVNPFVKPQNRNQEWQVQYEKLGVQFTTADSIYQVNYPTVFNVQAARNRGLVATGADGKDRIYLTVAYNSLATIYTYVKPSHQTTPSQFTNTNVNESVGSEFAYSTDTANMYVVSIPISEPIVDTIPVVAALSLTRTDSIYWGVSPDCRALSVNTIQCIAHTDTTPVATTQMTKYVNGASGVELQATSGEVLYQYNPADYTVWQVQTYPADGKVYADLLVSRPNAETNVYDTKTGKFHKLELVSNQYTTNGFLTYYPLGTCADYDAKDYTFDVTAEEFPATGYYYVLWFNADSALVSVQYFKVARQAAPIYAVNFNFNGGGAECDVPYSDNFADTTLIFGRPINRPADPFRCGHLFMDWHNEAGLVFNEVDSFPNKRDGANYGIRKNYDLSAVWNYFVTISNPNDTAVVAKYGLCEINTLDYVVVPKHVSRPYIYTYHTDYKGNNYESYASTGNANCNIQFAYSENPTVLTVGDTTLLTWSITDQCDSVHVVTQQVGVLFPPCGSDNFDPESYPFTQLGVDYTTSIDGYTYPTTRIGCNCWTAKNMQNTHYSDGDSIAFAHPYNNDNENVDIYGRLYTWYSAVDMPENSTEMVQPNSDGRIQGICPEGWALPTISDINTLTDFQTVDMISTDNWLPIITGTNGSGFNAQPAGFYNVQTVRYENLLGYTGYWTCEQPTPLGGVIMELSIHCEYIRTPLYSTNNRYSIRCVKYSQN